MQLTVWIIRDHAATILLTHLHAVYAPLSEQNGADRGLKNERNRS
jgi:hypothetical protein